MEKQHKITMTVVMDEGEREVVLTFDPAIASSEHVERLANDLADANEVCSMPLVEGFNG